ncbi:MAG: DUF2145 domain-containing protein [Hylemonella sp.]|nr:DUF2145 domain-containing protein [Hylemonella sp.]
MGAFSLVRGVLVLCLAIAGSLALAGQTCGEKPPTVEGSAKSASLSAQVLDELERQQLSFALIARVGVDLSEFGLHYSHVGVAWRDHPKGQWYTFHLLNRCGTGQSELVEQSLADFFNVELHSYRALVAAPTFPTQLKLQRAFFGPQARQLHEIEYNMISHPFSTKFQNSNQWVLEVMASALAPAGTISSRQTAQDWLRDKGYTPSVIPISLPRRAGARLFSPHVRFSDHSSEEFSAGRYAVVSVDSVLAFLRNQNPGLREIDLAVGANAAAAAPMAATEPAAGKN